MAEFIWSDEEVQASAAELGLTAGADADLPDAVRFVRRIREVLSAALAKHGRLSAPAVYLLVQDVPESIAERCSYHRRIHTGDVDPSGRAWLVGAAGRNGHATELGCSSHDEIFVLVCEQLQLGAAPAVYCDTSAEPPTLAWYPNGLADPDKLYEGPVQQEQPPSLQELIEVVDRVHKTRLMTTRNQGVDTTLWEDGSRHWVHSKAERRVQDALMAGLGGAFGAPFLVEQEVPGDSGRFDVGFREAIAEGTTRLHAILELKVARSYGSTGSTYAAKDTAQHIMDGVEQAWSYADEHGARDAACLVFDLRVAADHGVPPEAAERAQGLDVRLESWPCFPTATDYRAFRLPAAP